MSVMKVNGENFEAEVMNSDKKVLIDFFAEWCGPCGMLSPIVDEISGETDAKVVKVDVDESPELAQAFGVSSIPTLVVIKDKKVINQSIGLKSKDAVLSMLG